MRYLLLIPAVVLLGACSSPLKAPPSRSADKAFVTERLPTEGEKGTATSLDKSYFGVSGASGNAAVGLALGPLGVLANVQYIASENKRRAGPLAELTSQNLAKVLAGEIPGLRTNQGASNASYELVPGANLRFVSPTTYRLECSITASATGGERWIMRYATTADAWFDSLNGEDTKKADAALGPCLRTAHTLFTEHLGDSLEPFQSRELAFRGLDGAIVSRGAAQVSTPALPERLVVKYPWGFVQYRKGDAPQLLN
jgi:hypothetical protein